MTATERRNDAKVPESVKADCSGEVLLEADQDLNLSSHTNSGGHRVATVRFQVKVSPATSCTRAITKSRLARNVQRILFAVNRSWTWTKYATNEQPTSQLHVEKH